ncbi:hypothetical protein FHX34_102366 [Actinoplanes teichomyceticus]|uniref:Uncharacterized protein n=2 Tax=Actinoplanes teichomyceticus TaxID=1867 RepID=A0A561WIW7_ACTTI|nr:hypothetical protein FHX34_102366 [Actinoplanes teichomyceticus]GIF11861.1 hypothetical protein Ate01nite_18930 [Actinoplanes teichomyceticus]
MSLWLRIRDELRGAWRSVKYDLGRRPAGRAAGPDVTSTGLSTFPGALMEWRTVPAEPDARPPRRLLGITALCLVALVGAIGSYLLVTRSLADTRADRARAAAAPPAATTHRARPPADRPPGHRPPAKRPPGNRPPTGEPPATEPPTGEPASRTGPVARPGTAASRAAATTDHATGRAPVPAGTRAATRGGRAPDTAGRPTATRPRTGTPECHCVTPPAPTPTSPASSAPVTGSPAPAEPSGAGSPTAPGASAEPATDRPEGDTGHRWRHRHRWPKTG